MAQIQTTSLVRRPPEEVFAFLNAPENHARFIPNMADFQQTSPGAFGRVGATARGLLNYFGLVKIGVQYEVIEHELNHRLAMKGVMGPVLFRDGYILKKNGNATEIQFWLELQPTGWTKLFSPFSGLIGKIHAYETLRNLRRELASQALASHGEASQSSRSLR